MFVNAHSEFNDQGTFELDGRSNLYAAGFGVPLCFFLFCLYFVGRRALC